MRTLGNHQKAWIMRKSWCRNFIAKIGKCWAGQMLNKVERFSLCGQANTRGFLPYNPELKKEVNV